MNTITTLTKFFDSGDIPGFVNFIRTCNTQIHFAVRDDIIIVNGEKLHFEYPKDRVHDFLVALFCPW